MKHSSPYKFVLMAGLLNHMRDAAAQATSERALALGTPYKLI